MIREVLLVVIGAVVAETVREHFLRRQRGSREAPLPAALEPPTGRLVYPQPVPLDQAALHRALESVLGRALPLGQTAVYRAHAAWSAPELYGNNPALLLAAPDWPGAWTKIRQPVEVRGEPQQRWVNIRAYASLTAGVADWLQSLPAEARAAALQGDVEAYAAALARVGAVRNPTVLAQHLADVLETLDGPDNDGNSR